MDNVLIVYTVNNLYIGKYRTEDKHNNLILNDVLTINTTIRDDKTLNFGRINFIDNRQVYFNNYIFYSNADEVTTKLYIDFLESM